MLFEGGYKTQDFFRYFLHSLFSVPSFIFSKNGRGLLLAYHQRSFYMCIDPLKLKGNKLFESSDADLPWPFFLKKPTCIGFCCHFTVNGRKLFQARDLVNEESPPLHHQNSIK